MASSQTQFSDYLKVIPELRAEMLPRIERAVPCDREKLEFAVRRIYQFRKQKHPAFFLWIDSPLQAIAVVHLLAQLYEQRVHTQFRPEPSEMPLVPDLLGAASHRGLRTPDLRGWFGSAFSDKLTLVDPTSVNDFVQASLRHGLQVDAERLSGHVWRIDTLYGAAALLTEQLSNADLSEATELFADRNVQKILAQQEMTARVPFQNKEWKENEEAAAAARFSWATTLVPVPNPGQEVTDPDQVCRSVPWRMRHLQNCHSPLSDGSSLMLVRLCELMKRLHPTKHEFYFDALDAGGWWWPMDDVCVVSEGPSKLHLRNGLPHHDSDHAVAFGDWGMHAVNGVRVSENVIRNAFTLEDIINERNVEVRRVMIDRFGLSKFVTASDAKELHRDECGVLYEIQQKNDEPLVVVQVTNSTPEADGSFRTYHLRVPPRTRTARAGVAWSFGMREEDYQPTRES